MKYLLHIIAASILVIIGIFAPENLGTEFIGAGLSFFVIFLLVEIGYDIYENYGLLKLYIRTKLLRDKEIRFSISYQYRIKVNDKYLLVKNSNWDFYQHVGGKYKRLPVTQKIFNDYKIKDDLGMKTTGKMKNDLVGYIPAKHAVSFIKWFECRENREISHWREFYEELIEGKGNVLSKENFPYVDYHFAGFIRTPLRKSPVLGCWEILIYDVLDLLPNEAQQTELEMLLNSGDTEYVKWADHDLIQSLGYDSRSKETKYRIAEHTKWVLDLKTE